MKSSFSIEENEFGMTVRGPLPASDIKDLGRLWKRPGLTDMAMGVASALGATLAVTKKGGAAAWEKAIEAEARKKAGEDEELAWLLGASTGLSSLTIFSVLSERHAGEAIRRLGPWGSNVPLDPDDFRRCRRLLETVPGWRGRLGEVAAAYPEWGPLVRDWETLEALYVEELPSGRCPKLYERMQVLIEEGRSKRKGAASAI